jgi:hypothetical protein
MSNVQKWFWYFDDAQGMWDLDMVDDGSWPETGPEPGPETGPGVIEHVVAVAEPVAVKPRYNHRFYNHRFWPSPRASNMARALGRKGRNDHAKALVFLAERASVTVAELLEITPGAYIRKYAAFESNPYLRRWGV